MEIPVPTIIEPNTFEQVQRQLQARSPKRQAPRVTTGPILLTGLAVCATCRGGMTLRTGTSKGGRVYRYYACSNCATKGKTVCKGRSIAMQKLDTLVTEHLLERLFKPERVAVILASLSSRRAEQAAALNARITALQREMIDAEDKLKRLYRLVEDGLTDLDEVLKDRLNTLKADRDRAKAALERAKEHSATQIQIDPALIERFGRTMRENFSTGSVPFRKAYLRSLIDVIEVDDHQVRIKGRKDLLEKAVLASQDGQTACSQMSTRWRARRDSNSRPLPSEGNGLLLIGNRRHENAQQAGPACLAIDLEKNWTALAPASPRPHVSPARASVHRGRAALHSCWAVLWIEERIAPDRNPGIGLRDLAELHPNVALAPHPRAPFPRECERWP